MILELSNHLLKRQNNTPLQTPQWLYNLLKNIYTHILLKWRAVHKYVLQCEQKMKNIKSVGAVLIASTYTLLNW